MRVNKWGAGVALAAAVMLTGCAAGSEEPVEDKPAATEETEEAAPASDCPELADGATVDGAALGGCISDAMADTAGYAATTSTMGMESTGRYNPSTEAVESISDLGSVIVIGDEAWVKAASTEWQVADPNSSDPMIAGLSTGAAAVSESDLASAAALLSGEFTVTGTGERLGQEVFLLSGTVESAGVSVDTVYEVTSDFVVLASTGTAEVSGQKVETIFAVTEWDVAQDIVAPL